MPAYIRTEVEDYGFWRCRGYDGIAVRLSAGDRRMYVSFGINAADEPAAGQTFPGSNNMSKGTVQWRLERSASGTLRPFAIIVRWNVKIDEGRILRGRVLVVTRPGAGGVCHVGYVDALANRTPMCWRGGSPTRKLARSGATRTSGSCWAR